MKRGMLAAVLAAALLLGGCGGGSGDSTPATTEAAEQMQVLYDKEALDPDCAAVTERYFQAIQDQDFDAYKACIFPVYYEHMEQMLQTNYQYGMEQSFRKRCAGFLGEGHASYQITSLQMEYAAEESLDSYFSSMESIFGAEFQKDIQDAMEENHVILFTLKVRFDNAGEEQTLVQDNELILAKAKADGTYYVFG